MPYSDPAQQREYHRNYHLHGKIGRPKPTLEERFWAKVDASGDCWVWTASRLSNGYGHIKVNGASVGAHRVALALSLGRPLTEGEHVCHRCDNPPCVRPDHLFIGTAADNVADRHAKGHTSRPPASAEELARRSVTMRATVERKRHGLG
jgi:hypothetical protein